MSFFPGGPWQFRDRFGEKCLVTLVPPADSKPVEQAAWEHIKTIEHLVFQAFSHGGATDDALASVFLEVYDALTNRRLSRELPRPSNDPKRLLRNFDRELRQFLRYALAADVLRIVRAARRTRRQVLLGGPTDGPKRRRYTRSRLELPVVEQPDGDPAVPWRRTLVPLNLSDVYSIYVMSAAPGFLLSANALDVNVSLAAPVAEASAFMGALADTGHSNTHIFFSTLRNTDEQVDYTAPAAAEQWVKTASGDGTVPGISGACLNIAQANIKSRQSFTGLDHSGVYQDAAFNDTVVQKVALLLSARS